MPPFSTPRRILVCPWHSGCTLERGGGVGSQGKNQEDIRHGRVRGHQVRDSIMMSISHQARHTTWCLDKVTPPPGGGKIT